MRYKRHLSVREDPSPRAVAEEFGSDGGLREGPADGSAEIESVKVRHQWGCIFPKPRRLCRKRSDMQQEDR